MVTTDDFLFELVLAVELELGAELDGVALTVSCPAISEYIYIYIYIYAVSPNSRQCVAKTKCGLT